MVAPFFGNTPSAFPTRGGTITPGWAGGTAGSRPTTRSGYGGYSTAANYTGYFQSPQQPSRTSGALGLTRAHLAAYASGNTLFSALNSAGIEVLRVQSTGTATFQLQYWNGASWTGVGSAVAITGGTTPFYRWQVDFTGMGSGSGTLRVRVINDDTSAVVMDESASGLTLTSATNVDRLRVYNGNNNTATYGFTEAFIKDGSALSAYVYGEYLSTNGTDTDGTGGEPEMDDNSTTTPDTDFASLPSSGNRRSVVSAARSFGGRVVKGVGFECRLRCGATGPTQVKPYLKIGGTRYYHSSSPVTLTTTFADYWFGWDTDPSTGSAWGATNAESTNTEFGIEVV